MVTRSTILEKVIQPSRGNLSAELARYLLTLDFPEADHARYQQLAEKAQSGTLTEQEIAELDDFLSVNDFLTIIQAKAQSSLKKNGSAP
jgi:hypothetical protein